MFQNFDFWTFFCIRLNIAIIVFFDSLEANCLKRSG